MLVASKTDLIALRKIGRIVALAREEMIKAIKPGISTIELDTIGEEVLLKYGARSAPKYEYNFPGSTCISLNDVAAHGIPSSRIIKEGDIINIDISAELDGYFSDTGATIPVGSISSIKKNLIDCSRSALDKAIKTSKAGVKINEIGKAIHNEARKHSFTVIKNLAGHGIGKVLHDSPNLILNYYDKHDHRVLKKGMVLALETFISTRAEYAIEQKDGWTLKTPDGSFVAQFEHTIVVTEKEPIVLTLV
ncbi:type I methionyl aminopeptidase [Anaeromicrobium sediminis]|uniref:Methionine aminopeptidase n=1 Tax=Anaeromicrobium sediminis TaxID=1478221 RepID=A0A267MHN7_9FIRM|nr:type I methionyl aminopeptidase [Anaeromicrobium sediminis]PAB59094.1 type I methionyl aminopeptidase [Anaeromicrobium sediminis]